MPRSENFLYWQTDIFGLLLDLADFCEDGRVRHNAIRLLDILPTAPLISNKLSEALLSENPQEAMRSFLSPEGQASKPARLLYILQVRTPFFPFRNLHKLLNHTIPNQRFCTQS